MGPSNLSVVDSTLPLAGGSFLVTGGAGLIGSHIVEQLLEARAARVVVLDNLSRGTLANLGGVIGHKAVKFHDIDVRDHQAMLPLFEGIDGVFHQAAVRITRCAEAPRECLDVLICGSFNVLECCVAQGVSKIVAASSASVYGLANSFPTTENHAPYNNRTWYGTAKATLEGMLRSFNDMYNLPYVALRYFNVYGPRMDIHGKYTEVLIRWLDCFDQGVAPKVFGRGLQTMDFVYVGDVARSNLLAMSVPASDDVVNVASGVETSLLELLQALANAAGVRLEGALAPEFLPERKVNPVPRRLADTSKAKALLGFSAEVGLVEGLRRLLDWRRCSKPLAA